MENIWSLTVRPIQLSLLTHLLITSCGVLSAEKHRLLEVNEPNDTSLLDWNCFNVAVNSAGNFSSPGFPVSLPVQPVFCEWKIETNSGDDATRRIQLDFHVVDLPRRRDVGHTACSCSYLSFGDFDSLGLRVEYGRVCDGRGFLRPFVSRGPSAWATMISTGDPRRRHRGLLVEVRHLRQHDDVSVDVMAEFSWRAVDAVVAVATLIIIVFSCAVPAFKHARREQRLVSRDREYYQQVADMRARLALINVQPARPCDDVQPPNIDKSHLRSSLRNMMPTSAVSALRSSYRRLHDDSRRVAVGQSAASTAAVAHRSDDDVADGDFVGADDACSRRSATCERAVVKSQVTLAL